MLFDDKDLAKLVKNVNTELGTMKTWFATNRLSLNVNKTSYILFHSSRKTVPDHKTIVLGQTKIKRESTAKFLGINLDENLNWKSHIKVKANQIARITAILSRLKHTLSINILKTIYSALILPHISYAIVAWGNIKNVEMTRLKTLQRKAIRLVSKAKYNSHADPLFRKLNLMKIDDIYTVQCIKLYLKNNTDTLPPYHSQQLVTNSQIHDHFTRQQQDIHHNPIKTKVEEQLLNYKISQAWDCLPNDIKGTLKSISSVHSLKNHLISKYKQNCVISDCHCRN